MDRQKVEQLQQDINALSQRYDARFAGKPRATRDLGELDEIIEGLEGLIERGQSLLNGDNSLLREVLETATENLETYQRERQAIAQAKRQGAEAVMGAQLATWANLVFDEYRRHFAGKNRATRDVGRMEEMIYELEAIREDMLALLSRKMDLESTREDLKVVENNLDMYESELERIREARTSGAKDERASALANAANEQFRIYRDQFAGKSRSTRRPALLERVLQNLQEILGLMEGLRDGGFSSDQNTRNIGIVRENMNTYRDELAQIKNARSDKSLEDLAGMLGGAANDIMGRYGEEFAGENRATRSLEALSTMCDELYELALQMREIQDESPEMASNNRNLEIVLDNLNLFRTEYRRIEDAKGMS